MFLLLEQREEVAAAQKQLVKSLRTEFKQRPRRNIGYPGATQFDLLVLTDGVYWYSSPDYSGPNTPRNLNWFGVLSDRSLEITVECNTAPEGEGRQLAGFFARDPRSGTVYLMHSGRVGGGTVGVSKNAFLAWSNEELIDVLVTDGSFRRGAIVMPIAGRAVTTPLKRYVDRIAAFKVAVRNGDLRTPEFKVRENEFSRYSPEPRGRRAGKRTSVIDYVSRHGDVVDALAKWREDQGLPRGGRIVNSRRADLGVTLGSELREVYEVKTSVDRFDAYCAIGQLMVHGTADACRRTIVIPEGALPGDVAAALARMGIQILRFKLDSEQATIL